MLDISGGKFLLVMIIGLVVLGPERLPVVVRTVCGWIRTLRFMAKSFQSDISRELNFNEATQSLKNFEQVDLAGLHPELKEPYGQLKEAENFLRENIFFDNRGIEGDENQTSENGCKPEINTIGPSCVRKVDFRSVYYGDPSTHPLSWSVDKFAVKVNFRAKLGVLCPKTVKVSDSRVLE